MSTLFQLVTLVELLLLLLFCDEPLLLEPIESREVANETTDRFRRCKGGGRDDNNDDVPWIHSSAGGRDNDENRVMVVGGEKDLATCTSCEARAKEMRILLDSINVRRCEP